MEDISILITGAGAPGILGTIYSLKNNFDNRKIRIIGTDINAVVVGKYVCDKFYQIPPASEGDRYLKNINKICFNEKIDVLIPQNTMELSLLSQVKDEFEKIGTKIIVSDKTSIVNSNNKYLLMQKCKEIGIPVGEFYLANSIDKLEENAISLGWPDKKIVVKPPISNGLRGVRIIDENFNPKNSFYSEKPNSLITNFDNLKQILGANFPELIVTEYLPGDEYTVDLFRKNNFLVVVPRIREMIRSGITFNGKVVEDKKIIKYSRLLAEKLGLEYCFGFQFKLDENGNPKILESNPRVQGTMVLSTLANANVIYLSVKAALNEPITLSEIRWDTRLLRYWGGVSELNGQKIGQI